MSSATATATIMSAIVWMASVHTPSTPMASRQPTLTSCHLQPAAR